MTAPSDLTIAVFNSYAIYITWSNPHTYDYMEVERSVSGGGFSFIAYVGSATTDFLDNACQDGTAYAYRLLVHSGTDSGYSNTASGHTSLLAPAGVGGSATKDSVTLTWQDECQNESGFMIYRYGVYLVTVGQNVQTYTATGLTPGEWHQFFIIAYNGVTQSPISNVVNIFTADPPNQPNNFTATATATSKIRTNWQDNALNENGFSVELSSTSASTGFAEIATVGPNVLTYEAISLSSNTQYWLRVRAYNDSGYSAYSNVATANTFAAIAMPTNLTVNSFSGTVAEIRFQDNSELEDFHCVERKTGTGAYAEIVQLAPNRTYYKDTGRTPGATYTYKARAKQGASSYSNYSNEAAVTMINTLTAPANLTVSEYQDTWLRLTWTKVADATGYKIAQSTPDEASYAVIATVDGDVEYLKVIGLTAGIKYYFKILVYNGAGDSAYAASINQTTRTAYLPSKFEKLIRKSKPKLISLFEINPLMVLAGFALSSGQTYTYELSFDERGAELSELHKNGILMTEATSIATVEATAGTWWHDIFNSKVYVHVADGGDPGEFLITGRFWLYFSNAAEQIFNGHDYLLIIADDGLPDISQEMQQFYGNNLIVTSGSVSLINALINKENFFDQRFDKYIWINAKVRMLAGGDGFAYSEFEAINTGNVNSYSITDQRMTFDLRDYRDGMHATLPLNRYSLNEFANLSSNAEGKVRPFAFGTIIGAVPICIDTTNRVFEFHNGRCKSITELRLNGVALSENTDYFVDYGLGQFVLARGLAWTSNDILSIDFHGATNTADEEINNGAVIFKYIMNEWLNIPSTDLGLDSIYATKAAKTTAPSLYIWKETGSQEVIRTIEQSLMVYSIQDEEGRIGLCTQQTAASSGIKYIQNEMVFDLTIEKNQESIFSGVNLYYNEDYANDKFTLMIGTATTIPWLYKVSKFLDVYVALSSATDAATLLTLILADLNKQQIKFNVTRSLYKSFPGDLIYFNRNRYPGLSGVASNLLVRILSISKQYRAGRTEIKAEVV